MKESDSATLALNSVERLADNALIARKFRALGFSSVRVSEEKKMRRVEGIWHRKDAQHDLACVGWLRFWIVALPHRPHTPC